MTRETPHHQMSCDEWYERFGAREAPDDELQHSILADSIYANKRQVPRHILKLGMYLNEAAVYSKMYRYSRAMALATVRAPAVKVDIMSVADCMAHASWCRAKVIYATLHARWLAPDTDKSTLPPLPTSADMETETRRCSQEASTLVIRNAHAMQKRADDWVRSTLASEVHPEPWVWPHGPPSHILVSLGIAAGRSLTNASPATPPTSTAKTKTRIGIKKTVVKRANRGGA